MITQIRQFLKKARLDALLVTRADSFLTGYYPPERNTLELASGFSGSAGMALITPDQAVLFVDSRYTEQAKTETNLTVFEVPTDTTPSAWMKQKLAGKTIGYNPWHHSATWLGYMESKELMLAPVSWQEWQALFPMPKIKSAPSFDYDVSYCGEDTASKIKKVVDVIRKNNLDAYIFTMPDSISYLLNRRSLWVPEYPVVFERLIVFSNGQYQELPDDPNLWSKKKVGLDLDLTPVGLLNKIKQKATVVSLSDPVALLKSVKNQVEQDNIRTACLFESHVLCRFLAWIEQNKDQIDELGCAAKLKELRTESSLYRGDSFDTIAAVGAHAALAHYQANTSSNTRITDAPMLLVDTGGNYLNGTTDMTRTICIGIPTALMKKRYTQVLKGHIALARTVLKTGDLPTQLDLNARQFLRADNVDYGHSTGHGIGMYLAVHETPPTIHEKAQTPLVAGMLFSNEPAFYDIQNGFGIRLENMILTLNGPNDTLILENLLWVPFDGRLIDFDALDTDEREWLRAYHRGIESRIFPTLSSTERDILKPLLDFFL